MYVPVIMKLNRKRSHNINYSKPCLLENDFLPLHRFWKPHGSMAGQRMSIIGQS